METPLPDAISGRMATGISDRRFAAQLRTIEKLKQFLFDEKVSIQNEYLADVDLGTLNNLTFDPSGRLPTEDEWRELDRKLAALTPLLSPELRLKLKIGELRFFFRKLPIVLMGISIAGFLCLFIITAQLDQKSDLYTLLWVVSALIWTLSQGALGACAFLGVSVAAQTAREKPSSDSLNHPTIVTDENILSTRIILGALFALLIGLPISGKALRIMGASFYENSEIPGPKDYITVLAPFMFGFSTSLVLGIFDRIVKGIEGLFGLSSETRR